MDNVYQQLADKIKAVTVFLLEHRGKCFAGMDAAKLFRYVAFHLLQGGCYVGYTAGGEVGFVLFTWPDNEAELRRREAAGEPQFVWRRPAVDGDAFFIGGVVGDRKYSQDVLRQVSGAWPESPRKKVFTYRKGRLVELTWATLNRFTYGLA